MERYGPIHPERPALRAAAAVAISVGVHAALAFLLALWGVAALAAARRVEAAQPKEVALTRLDASQWERNRTVERAVPPVEPEPPKPVRPAVAVAPKPLRAPPTPPEAKGAPPPASAPAPRAAGGGEGARSGLAAVDPERAGVPAGASPGKGPGSVDLSPRPVIDRPLAMRFDAIGDGPRPITEGTAFSGFTVQDPEAWRFANFFNRAVEAMNSVYRYELGAPLPPALYARWVADSRQTAACSYTWVALDARGKLLEAQVRKSSGMADLDALIVEVIRRTAPFANFPSGLLDTSGVYRDTWGLCIVRGSSRG